MIFVASRPIYYLHIFQQRCFVICSLMADVLFAHFSAGDVLLFVSSWPMFYSNIFRREIFYLFPRDRCLVHIFPGIRCYSICYLVTDLIRYWIYKYFMTCNVLLFPSSPFTNIGLYMFSGIRYLNTLMFCWDM